MGAEELLAKNSRSNWAPGGIAPEATCHEPHVCEITDLDVYADSFDLPGRHVVFELSFCDGEYREPYLALVV